MGASKLAGALAVAVVALAAALGWALARDGEGEQAPVPLRPQAAIPREAATGAPAQGQPSASVGGWTMGPGMMGFSGYGEARPVTSLADARREAQRFGGPLGLQPGEVIEFDNHFYVELLEAGGKRATEVLVDPATGAVWLEHGPAMMWNTRYGMIGGPGGGKTDMMAWMMGGGYGRSPLGAGPGPRPRGQLLP